MIINGVKLEKIHDFLWEIPRGGKMLVPGRIYMSQKLMEKTLQNDESIKQVINVAHLPGIVKYSMAMPDIHWGYGFPIGGVAATDAEEGWISPGGVGYDINCGVRLATTSLKYKKSEKKIRRLVEDMFDRIPTGVGAHGAIKKLNRNDVASILEKGSAWAVEQGFGSESDLETTEERGAMKDADSAAVSGRAIERGLNQAGTLGSGNHFAEIDVVEEVYDAAVAEVFGLFPGQIVVQIHTGSRGLGYQVCEDNLKLLQNCEEKYGLKLPDRQLAGAPLNSPEGKEYFTAMKCAANFAWNNRQIIMHLAKESFLNVLNISEQELRFNLLYDVAHNIAKIEEHTVDGETKKLCVHRKGATRAFGAESKLIPAKYTGIGQPVLIPGDMGRYSYIALGTSKAMEETFGSSCHGAGRVKSRSKALRSARDRDLVRELERGGLAIRAKGKKTIAEEMPEAYKDVADVVEIMHKAGITKKIAKIRPVGVIKG